MKLKVNFGIEGFFVHFFSIIERNYYKINEGHRRRFAVIR